MTVRDSPTSDSEGGYWIRIYTRVGNDGGGEVSALYALNSWEVDWLRETWMAVKII